MSVHEKGEEKPCVLVLDHVAFRSNRSPTHE